MSFYKKIPVLDEKEQAEFDKYLTEQYKADLDLAVTIVNKWIGGISNQGLSATGLLGYVFDKLATPRIYLLQAWLHRKSQEAAGAIATEEKIEPCAFCRGNHDPKVFCAEHILHDYKVLEADKK